MAVPFDVAYCTVTVCVLAGDSVTVNTALLVPELPSAFVTPAMLSVGSAVAVIVLLVASLVKPLLENKRAW